jgi:hypothetical protein
MLSWLWWNAVLTVVLAVLLVGYELIPVTVGLKIDLVACRVQYYQRFMGVNYPLDQRHFYYRDRVARLYKKYIGPWPDETQWVTDHESLYWLDDQHTDESAVFYGFIWHQNGLANMLSGRIPSLAKTNIPRPEDAASAHIILRFLQLARETGSPEASKHYMGMIWGRLDKDPHKLTLVELLDIERQFDAEQATGKAH